MTERTWGPLGEVILAEQRRGNKVTAFLHESEGLRGDLPHGYFKYPVDRAALDAEFELAPRLQWVEEPGKRPYLRDAQTDYYLYDGEEERGWWARIRRRDWWTEWERDPRPRRRLSE